MLASIDRLCITTLVESIQPKDRTDVSRDEMSYFPLRGVVYVLYFGRFGVAFESVLAQFLQRQKRVGGHAPVDPFFFFLFC